MIRNFDRWVIIAVIIILVGGVALTVWTAQTADNRLRQDLLTENRIVQKSINTGTVEALTGSESDLSSAGYLALKEQLNRVRSADQRIRFIYLMRQKPDGSVIILVDSEPPESGDYSPPGQTYTEASDVLRNVFVSKEGTTEGPSSDRWGTWISSITPVTDPLTGTVVAVLGIDVDAAERIILIVTACLPVATGTLILIFILLVFSYSYQRNEREKQILEESAGILRESEHQLNAIINFLPDATFVINTEGRVITWNKAIEEMTGIRAGDMLGKGNYEYALPFYGERRPILINLIQELDKEMEKKYTGGIQRAGDMLITETVVHRPDGSTPVLAARASPLRNVHGTIIGAIESIRDISFRIKAENELKNREERLRLLLQNINDGMIVHGGAQEGPGRILEVNDHVCQTLGYTREELLGMSVRDLDMAGQLEKAPVISDEVFSRKHTVFETSYRKKDGTRIPVEVSATYFELQGEPTVLAIVRDITERKLLEREKEYHSAELMRYADALQQVNEKLNLMNKITRHDILNQLTAILGYLGLMKDQVQDPKLQEYIAIEIRAAQNIQNQIMFTKEYQDIGSQSPKWLDLRSVILSAAEQLNLSSITLAVHCDGIEIYADPLFEKVFYTILENAIRHGKSVTDIGFSCHELESGLMVIYEDNGEGVPAGQKENIFQQKFFHHTGYGLFLSATILNITGITIRETGEPGTGARFEITVPRGAFRFLDRL
jgi:PAS domain S-box-containing protein